MFCQIPFGLCNPVCDEDFRLFSNDFFDLLKGVLNRVAIVGISRQCQGSQNNSTVTGYRDRDRDFAAEFKRFMGFAFGNTTDMGFVKAINFMFIGFVL